METVAGKAHGAVLECCRSALEGHPSEGVIGSLGVGNPPLEFYFAGCTAFAGVLLADFLDGAVTDVVKGRTASGTELVEIESCQVLFVPSPGFSAGLVAVVPDSVDFCSHPP